MALDLTVDVNKQLQPIVDRLADEYDGRLPRRTVERTVRQVQREFGNPPVTQFRPVLIEREVRASLR
jgi:hypothetical protein